MAMEAADKEIYLEIEKPEEDNLVLADTKAVQNELRKIFEDEKVQVEQNRQFDKRFADEVLIFRKRIVEAKMLNELKRIRILIRNRISFLGDRNFNDFPDLKTTRNEFKDLLKYVKEKIERRESPPEQNDNNGNPPFPTKFNESQLKTICARSKDKNVIKCSENDFMYWFAGKGASRNIIKWMLTGKEKKPHKSALFWYLRKLNPNATATIMNSCGAFNVKVRKNDNRYTPTMELGAIFNNL